MNMHDRKMLIIEDNPTEAQYVQGILGDRCVVAGTYRDFENVRKESISRVLSDLYFPSGYDTDTREHSYFKQQILGILDSYVSDNYAAGNPIAESIEAIKKIGLGKTPEEVLDKLADIEGEEGILKNPRIRSVIDNALKKDETRRKYVNLAFDIENDQHLMPLGIFVYRESKKNDIPCVIVTDAYHHGTEFQPFVNSVGRYYDQLIDGHKQWKDALES